MLFSLGPDRYTMTQRGVEIVQKLPTYVQSLTNIFHIHMYGTVLVSLLEYYEFIQALEQSHKVVSEPGKRCPTG